MPAATLGGLIIGSYATPGEAGRWSTSTDA